MTTNPVKRLLALVLCLCMVLGMYVPSVSAATVSYHDMSVSELLDLEEDLTWVFTGDSITHNGSWTAGYNDYAAWFEQYLYAIGRGDDTLINTAWGGAAIDHFQPGRSGSDGMGLEQFVTKYNPDVVFIKLGMNNRTMADATFVSKYKAMLDGIYAAGEANGKVPKIVILTPTPLSSESGISSGEFGSDPTREDYLGSVKRFSISLSGIAAEYGLEFVDLRQAMVDESAVLGDRYHYTFFSDPSDGQIHPNGAGQYFMFKTICKELGLYDETMPIFQVSYDDITDAALYGDNTIISNYAGDYDANHPVTTSKDPEMDKMMPTLEIVEGEEQTLGPKLLAAIDFTSENGVFTYNSSDINASVVDLTNADVMDDPLTVEEARTLQKEYSIVFRYKSNVPSGRSNMPIIYLAGTSSGGFSAQKNKLLMGMPGTSNIYYNVHKNGTSLSNLNTSTTEFGNLQDHVNSGAWHTIAIVQTANNLTYYVDGRAYAVSIKSNNTTQPITISGNIGEGFANVSAADFDAVLGRYGKTDASWKTQGDFDYWQFYGGALTADEVAYLTANSGNKVSKADNAAEMDKTMPTLTDVSALAAVDFDSTNGHIAGTSDYKTSQRVNLTDAEVMDDALTLDEVKALDREFTIVFRGRLDSTTHQLHQAVLMLTPGSDANWNNAISVGAPGVANFLYYEARQGGAEKTNNSTNTLDMVNAVASVTDEWHTIAIVQKTDKFEYYIDGKLAKEYAYKLNDGLTFGGLFADATEFTAHIGGFAAGSAATYNLKADLDYYQFYGTALTAEQIASLGGNAVAPTKAEHMNSDMPAMPKVKVQAAELLASIDFTSANGEFIKDTTSQTNYTVDLTDAEVMDDALTLAEAQKLGKEYSIAFRYKSTDPSNINMPIIYMSATSTGCFADQLDKLMMGMPGTKNIYYQVTKNKANNATFGGTTDKYGDLLTAVNDGKWHTIVITQSTSGLTYYVDGTAYTVLGGSNQAITVNSNIGELFANATETSFDAALGRYGNDPIDKNWKTAGMFDYYQFYSGALTENAIKELVANSGKDDDQAEMNETMPSILSAKPMASVDFDSTTGVFAGTGEYATSTQWDLTDAEKMDDALTLEEAKSLDREFSIVLRAKLDSTSHQTHQALLMITPGDGTKWNNAISVGGPGTKHNLYYETRQNGSEVTSSTNTVTLDAATQDVRNGWHTIAIVQRADGLDYYIDGALAQSWAYKLNDGKSFGSVFANATELTARVGSFASVDGAASYNLKAKLDFYQFYGSALSANQIRQLSGVDAAAEWTESTKANNLWAVVGADQMSGYLGETPNFSLFRLLNNGMRGGANEVGSYRDIRMMNLAKPGQTVSDVVANYDEILGEHQSIYDVLMVLPELPEIHAAGYVHSADKVAAYKANILTLIEKNADKVVVLWTPLASNDATINGYINDYANAVREIVNADSGILFFDANKFMNEHMAALGTNWFDDSMHITALCATDLAYAFYVHANYPLYDSSKNPTNMGELKNHNLRNSQDLRLYKTGVIKENLSYDVTVNGGSFTVDASAIEALGYTNLRVASIPAIGIGSVVEPWILGAAGQSLEAPHSNPSITVYGEKDGMTYRFKDVQLALTTSNNYTEPYFETDDLTALEVVGAPAIGFDPSKTTYDVEVYQYQRYARIKAEGGSNLTIKVNGETVKAGEFSQYIAVDNTATVTVTVTGGAADKTYTLNLTRSDYADIIITEVMSDGYDGYTAKGADNYELIEIYNASGEDLNLLDYSIGYIRDYPYENEIGEDSQTPYYFIGNDQKFNKQTYLGINQITKYSSYWTDKVDQEPEEVIFPADSTMVIWVKFSKDTGTTYGSTLTYETLIAALEAHSGTHTLTVEVEENGETVTKTIVPNQDQLVVAEIPYGAKQSNVTQDITTTAENFYMDNFTTQKTTDSDNRRAWLFVLDDKATFDYYGALTADGDDIISAAKNVRVGSTNKLSNVMYYDVERGMSVVKDAGSWDTSDFTGHTSDQQGYANLTSFGAIEYWQKPYDLADTAAAIIANNTPAKVELGSDAAISLAITDDQDIRYIELYVDADNDGTYETVIKKDITLITSATNAGKAADVNSYELTYALTNVQNAVNYYGFVLDGNNNKTEIGSAEAPVTMAAMEKCEHSYTAEQTKAPTCTEEGEMTYTCSACGDTYTEVIKPAGEHSYNEGVQTKAPTCTEEGEMTYTCSACSHSYTEAIDAIGHTGDVICTTCGQFLVEAGETAVLTGDLNIAELVIPADITLDLNGHTVTAESVVSFGKVIDSAEAGALIAGNVLFYSESNYMPIYDTTVEGYRFFAYEQKNLGVRVSGDKATFGFMLDFKNAAAYELLANSEDADIGVTMTLACGEDAKTFAFSSDLIRQYAALQVKYPALRAAMMLNVSGLDTLESGAVLTVTAAVNAAEGQIVTTNEAMTYTR